MSLCESARSAVCFGRVIRPSRATALFYYFTSFVAQHADRAGCVVKNYYSVSAVHRVETKDRASNFSKPQVIKLVFPNVVSWSLRYNFLLVAPSVILCFTFANGTVHGSKIFVPSVA